GHRYTYYHCTWKKPCGQKTIQLPLLERQIADFLGRLAVPCRALDWAFAYLAEAETSTVASQQVVRQSLDEAIAKTERQIKTLTQMRARELISDEEFTAERRTLQEVLPRLRAEADVSVDSAQAIAATAETFLFAARAYDWFRSADPQSRR